MADTFLLITSFFFSAHRITFIKTSVQIDGERSEEFEVIVRVQQGSVLSLVLFVIDMDENTNGVREGGIKKLLYADDLVLLGKKKG